MRREWVFYNNITDTVGACSDLLSLSPLRAPTTLTSLNAAAHRGHLTAQPCMIDGQHEQRQGVHQ